jgi:hypothetical protein
MERDTVRGAAATEALPRFGALSHELGSEPVFARRYQGQDPGSDGDTRPPGRKSERIRLHVTTGLASDGKASLQGPTHPREAFPILDLAEVTKPKEVESERKDDTRSC